MKFMQLHGLNDVLFVHQILVLNLSSAELAR